MTWLPATRLEKLVGSFTDDVRQAPNDTAHCVRAIFYSFGILFGWIRFHIDLNSLPIAAFREVDCSAFANNLASRDILPPPMNASVKTTSVYRIASCDSVYARGLDARVHGWRQNIPRCQVICKRGTINLAKCRN